jgi:YVTN family beta-propeller protein
MRFLPCLFASLLLAAPVFAGSPNSLLDISPDGKWLLVTNTDNDSVTVVDTTARKAVREIPVGDHPEGIAWIGNGPLAIVTLYRADQVMFLDTDAGKVVATLDVADEPYGVVTTRDGKRSYVTHDYPGTISEIDTEARKVVRTVKVGEWSRGIAISPDEKRLYVTNYHTGQLHAVEIESGKVVDTWNGHSTDNLSRNVVLHPTRPKAYQVHIRSKVVMVDGRGSIFPQLTISDLWSPKEPGDKRRTSIALDTYNGVYVVTNPWEAAITPDGKRIFTIYAGTEDMNVSSVIDDDYSEVERIDRAIRLGQNPRAVRVSPDGKWLYVYNTLDYAVDVFDISSGVKKVGSVSVCKPPHTPEWVRGNVLFTTASRPMSAARWVACASCHPDGQPDGRVWQNPEGPRKTPPLAGVAHTHPLHYSGDRDEVQDFEYTIRGKLMGGPGLLKGPLKPKTTFYPPIELEEHLAGRSKDLDALAIYTNSFPITLSPHIVAPGKLTPAAERGRALFFSNETSCATCHSGPYFTDSSLQKPFKLHDIGTGDDPAEKMPPEYDTPSLIGIYRSAPYLHHGKAKTLMEVLTTFNKGNRHGKTSHLSAEQKEDLVAFLKSIPYEPPPNETPNSVPYRLKRKAAPEGRKD